MGPSTTSSPNSSFASNLHRNQVGFVQDALMDGTEGIFTKNSTNTGNHSQHVGRVIKLIEKLSHPILDVRIRSLRNLKLKLHSGVLTKDKRLWIELLSTDAFFEALYRGLQVGKDQQKDLSNELLVAERNRTDVGHYETSHENEEITPSRHGGFVEGFYAEIVCLLYDITSKLSETDLMNKSMNIDINIKEEKDKNHMERIISRDNQDNTHNVKAIWRNMMLSSGIVRHLNDALSDNWLKEEERNIICDIMSNFPSEEEYLSVPNANLSSHRQTQLQVDEDIQKTTVDIMEKNVSHVKTNNRKDTVNENNVDFLHQENMNHLGIDGDPNPLNSGNISLTSEDLNFCDNLAYVQENSEIEYTIDEINPTFNIDAPLEESIDIEETNKRITGKFQQNERDDLSGDAQYTDTQEDKPLDNQLDLLYHGFKFPTVLLAAKDEKVLFEFQIRIGLRRDDVSYLALCRSFRLQMLRDFPPEIFLNNSYGCAILQLLLAQVHRPLKEYEPNFNLSNNQTDNQDAISCGVLTSESLFHLSIVRESLLALQEMVDRIVDVALPTNTDQNLVLRPIPIVNTREKRDQKKSYESGENELINKSSTRDTNAGGLESPLSGGLGKHTDENSNARLNIAMVEIVENVNKKAKEINRLRYPCNVARNRQGTNDNIEKNERTNKIDESQSLSMGGFALAVCNAVVPILVSHHTDLKPIVVAILKKISPYLIEKEVQELCNQQDITNSSISVKMQSFIYLSYRRVGVLATSLLNAYQHFVNKFTKSTFKSATVEDIFINPIISFQTIVGLLLIDTINMFKPALLYALTGRRSPEAIKSILNKFSVSDNSIRDIINVYLYSPIAKLHSIDAMRHMSNSKSRGMGTLFNKIDVGVNLNRSARFLSLLSCVDPSIFHIIKCQQKLIKDHNSTLSSSSSQLQPLNTEKIETFMNKFMEVSSLLHLHCAPQLLERIVSLIFFCISDVSNIITPQLIIKAYKLLLSCLSCAHLGNAWYIHQLILSWCDGSYEIPPFSSVHLQYFIDHSYIGNERKDIRYVREVEPLQEITGWTKDEITELLLTNEKRQELLQRLYFPPQDSPHQCWSKELLFYLCRYDLDMEYPNKISLKDGIENNLGKGGKEGSTHPLKSGSDILQRAETADLLKKGISKASWDMFSMLVMHISIEEKGNDHETKQVYDHILGVIPCLQTIREQMIRFHIEKSPVKMTSNNFLNGGLIIDSISHSSNDIKDTTTLLRFNLINSFIKRILYRGLDIGCNEITSGQMFEGDENCSRRLACILRDLYSLGQGIQKQALEFIIGASTPNENYTENSKLLFTNFCLFGETYVNETMANIFRTPRFITSNKNETSKGKEYDIKHKVNEQVITQPVFTIKNIHSLLHVLLDFTADDDAHENALVQLIGLLTTFNLAASLELNVVESILETLSKFSNHVHENILVFRSKANNVNKTDGHGFAFQRDLNEQQGDTGENRDNLSLEKISEKIMAVLAVLTWCCQKETVKKYFLSNPSLVYNLVKETLESIHYKVDRESKASSLYLCLLAYLPILFSAPVIQGHGWRQNIFTRDEILEKDGSQINELTCDLISYDAWSKGTKLNVYPSSNSNISLECLNRSIIVPSFVVKVFFPLLGSTMESNNMPGDPQSFSQKYGRTAQLITSGKQKFHYSPIQCANVKKVHQTSFATEHDNKTVLNTSDLQLKRNEVKILKSIIADYWEYLRERDVYISNYVHQHILRHSQQEDNNEPYFLNVEAMEKNLMYFALLFQNTTRIILENKVLLVSEDAKEYRRKIMNYQIRDPYFALDILRACQCFLKIDSSYREKLAEAVCVSVTDKIGKELTCPLSFLTGHVFYVIENKNVKMTTKADSTSIDVIGNAISSSLCNNVCTSKFTSIGSIYSKILQKENKSYNPSLEISQERSVNLLQLNALPSSFSYELLHFLPLIFPYFNESGLASIADATTNTLIPHLNLLVSGITSNSRIISKTGNNNGVGDVGTEKIEEGEKEEIKASEKIPMYSLSYPSSVHQLHYSEKLDLMEPPYNDTKDKINIEIMGHTKGRYILYESQNNFVYVGSTLETCVSVTELIASFIQKFVSLKNVNLYSKMTKQYDIRNILSKLFYPAIDRFENNGENRANKVVLNSLSHDRDKKSSASFLSSTDKIKSGKNISFEEKASKKSSQYIDSIVSMITNRTNLLSIIKNGILAPFLLKDTCSTPSLEISALQMMTVLFPYIDIASLSPILITPSFFQERLQYGFDGEDGITNTIFGLLSTLMRICNRYYYPDSFQWKEIARCTLISMRTLLTSVSIHSKLIEWCWPSLICTDEVSIGHKTKNSSHLNAPVTLLLRFITDRESLIRACTYGCIAQLLPIPSATRKFLSEDSQEINKSSSGNEFKSIPIIEAAHRVLRDRIECPLVRAEVLNLLFPSLLATSMENNMTSLTIPYLTTSTIYSILAYLGKELFASFDDSFISTAPTGLDFDAYSYESETESRFSSENLVSSKHFSFFEQVTSSRDSLAYRSPLLLFSYLSAVKTVCISLISFPTDEESSNSIGEINENREMKGENDLVFDIHLFLRILWQENIFSQFISFISKSRLQLMEQWQSKPNNIVLKEHKIFFSCYKVIAELIEILMQHDPKSKASLLNHSSIVDNILSLLETLTSIQFCLTKRFMDFRFDRVAEGQTLNEAFYVQAGDDYDMNIKYVHEHIESLLICMDAIWQLLYSILVLNMNSQLIEIKAVASQFPNPQNHCVRLMICLVKHIKMIKDYNEVIKQDTTSSKNSGPASSLQSFSHEALLLLNLLLADEEVYNLIHNTEDSVIKAVFGRHVTLEDQSLGSSRDDEVVAEYLNHRKHEHLCPSFFYEAEETLLLPAKKEGSPETALIATRPSLMIFSSLYLSTLYIFKEATVLDSTGLHYYDIKEETDARFLKREHKNASILFYSNSTLYLVAYIIANLVRYIPSLQAAVFVSLPTYIPSDTQANDMNDLHGGMFVRTPCVLSIVLDKIHILTKLVIEEGLPKGHDGIKSSLRFLRSRGRVRDSKHSEKEKEPGETENNNFKISNRLASLHLYELRMYLSLLASIMSDLHHLSISKCALLQYENSKNEFENFPEDRLSILSIFYSKFPVAHVLDIFLSLYPYAMSLHLSERLGAVNLEKILGIANDPYFSSTRSSIVEDEHKTFYRIQNKYSLFTVLLQNILTFSIPDEEGVTILLRTAPSAGSTESTPSTLPLNIQKGNDLISKIIDLVFQQGVSVLCASTGLHIIRNIVLTSEGRRLVDRFSFIKEACMNHLVKSIRGTGNSLLNSEQIQNTSSNFSQMDIPHFGRNGNYPSSNAAVMYSSNAVQYNVKTKLLAILKIFVNLSFSVEGQKMLLEVPGIADFLSDLIAIYEQELPFATKVNNVTENEDIIVTLCSLFRNLSFVRGSSKSVILFADGVFAFILKAITYPSLRVRHPSTVALYCLICNSEKSIAILRNIGTTMLRGSKNNQEQEDAEPLARVLHHAKSLSEIDSSLDDSKVMISSGLLLSEHEIAFMTKGIKLSLSRIIEALSQ